MNRKVRNFIMSILWASLIVCAVITADQISRASDKAEEIHEVKDTTVMMDSVYYTSSPNKAAVQKSQRGAGITREYPQKAAAPPMDEVMTFAMKEKKENIYQKNCTKYGLDDENLDFFTKCVFQEVRGTTYKCKRLVVDVILNRADKRKDKSVRNVITAKGQFSVYPDMMDSTPKYEDMSYENRKNWDDCVKAIKTELSRKKKNRCSNEVMYFRSGHYHSFATDVVHEGTEYFSK